MLRVRLLEEMGAEPLTGPLQFHQRGTGNGLSVLRLSAQACTA